MFPTKEGNCSEDGGNTYWPRKSGDAHASPPSFRSSIVPFPLLSNFLPGLSMCGVAVSRGKAADGEREAASLRWAIDTGVWAEVSDSRT